MIPRLRIAGFAAVAALAMAVVSSLSPIAFDQKLLSATAPVVSGAPQHVVYVSEHADMNGGHITQYGLPLALPPGATVTWLVLSPQPADPSWPPDGVIGYVPLEGTVIAENDSVLRELQRRGISAELLRMTPRTIAARPHWRFDSASLARLFLLLFAFFLFVSAFGGSWIAVVAFLPLHACLVYLAGLATAHSVVVALVLEIAVLLFFEPLRFEWPRYVVPLAIVALLLFLVRLDLDGDLLTHWLPLARAHHALGRHDLAFLIAHYHAGHRVAYPPGFPIVLSTLLWVADVPASGGLHAGDALHNALFLYRAAAAMMAFATLAAFTIRTRNPWLTLLLAILIPLFLGRPAAAEVWFVPVMFAAMIRFSTDDAPARTMAAALAGAALLIKADAKLAVPLVVLPWALTPRPTRREIAAFVAAAVPFGVLSFLQRRAGVVTTFDFGPISVAGLHRIPLVLRTAFEILLDSNFWVALAALPVVAIAAARRHAAIVTAATGVAIYLAAMTCVYLFSAHDVVHHMQTSYERVLAIVVCSVALMIACTRSTNLS